MRILVTGAASSGKSAWAESRVLGLSRPRYYVATMSPGGGEAAARIERHRLLREGKGFETVELFPAGTHMPDVPALLAARGVRGGTALVEDLGNLLANRLFMPDGTEVAGELALARCEADLAAVCERCEDVVFVGDEVGADGCVAAEGQTDATSGYVRLLGVLACRVAQSCDEVVEVVSSVPNYVKGGPTHDRA